MPEKNKGGRPKKDIDAEQVTKLAAMGATIHQIAFFFDADIEDMLPYESMIDENLPENYMSLRLRRYFSAMGEISATEKRKIYLTVFPHRKAHRNVSIALKDFIHKIGSKASIGSTLKFLGYTERELIEHLESKFEDGMNWENYGSYWHIDHIIPQSWFIKKCWSLENLQPLKAFDNMSKGNKWAG